MLTIFNFGLRIQKDRHKELISCNYHGGVESLENFQNCELTTRHKCDKPHAPSHGFHYYMIRHRADATSDAAQKNGLYLLTSRIHNYHDCAFPLHLLLC